MRFAFDPKVGKIVNISSYGAAPGAMTLAENK